MAMLDKLVALASHATPLPTGIDWESIKRRTGQTPEQDVYGMGEYRQQLATAFREVAQVRAKLRLSYAFLVSHPIETLAAWDEAERAFDSSFERAMAAINANFTWFSGAPEFHTETWRAIVTKMHISLVSGIGAHLQVLPQLGGMSEREIIEWADRLHGGCQAFVQLDKLGYLNPIKKAPSAAPRPTSGIGVVFETGEILIVLALTVVVCFVAYLIYQNKKDERYIEYVKDVCRRAERAPPETKQDLMERCGRLEKAIVEQIKKDEPITDVLKLVVTILSVGLLAYGGFLLLPHFTKALAKSRAQKQLPAKGAT